MHGICKGCQRPITVNVHDARTHGDVLVIKSPYKCKHCGFAYDDHAIIKVIKDKMVSCNKCNQPFIVFWSRPPSDFRAQGYVLLHTHAQCPYCKHVHAPGIDMDAVDGDREFHINFPTPALEEEFKAWLMDAGGEQYFMDYMEDRGQPSVTFVYSSWGVLIAPTEIDNGE